ncbi:axonemal dynein light intermediate polypeptide 1 isoform X2 [Stegastes partitus]|uniref:Axonemal dynein light intermediate polypeptide 1 n=1 Tax=Stegastes partitus TaxID=144197 RepID=A0A9Y4KAH6_9TELE|nr:PREDICTED: axonemal dynein light intermediate polypeptide 1 isoform X2 [Stegastes partitus]
MISPADSLLKYENPVLVRESSDTKSPKGRPLRVSPQPADSAPVPPPPKPKAGSSEAIQQQNQQILNDILPPREWIEGNQLWVQQVSSVPCTRADVINLEELLDKMLQQRQARQTGICPVRWELYSQCFDELIRQVTINCAERGMLLLRVRDQIQMTIAAYQTLYESSVAFRIRKALQAEEGKVDMEKRILDLEDDNKALRKKLNEQRTKCDEVEKREVEKRQVEEEKYRREIQLLQRTNEQLKVQLEGIIRPKK